MDTIFPLHTAARRFCIAELRSGLSGSDLQSAESFKVEDYFGPGWTDPQDAYDMFPRYRLAESTLRNHISPQNQGGESTIRITSVDLMMAVTSLARPRVEPICLRTVLPLDG